ncbi:MAG: DUF2288 domain-containing protein [Gammaproteobacteria bacterium]|nr:DUF2288 domain-containing protein [Gammaproteobacteria bacterium]
MDNSEDLLKHELNNQTAKLEWQELERHFARGVVIKIAPQLDLVEVALCMSRDDKTRIAAWMEDGHVGHPSIEDAQRWVENKPLFWAVVAAPWVLIQEIED